MGAKLRIVPPYLVISDTFGIELRRMSADTFRNLDSDGGGERGGAVGSGQPLVAGLGTTLHLRHVTGVIVLRQRAWLLQQKVLLVADDLEPMRLRIGACLRLQIAAVTLHKSVCTLIGFFSS